jgi:hypothetical protein
MPDAQLEPGSAGETKWLATIQQDDVVHKGTEIMGRYAGANDPLGIHTSKYLVTIGLPAAIMDSLVSRHIIPVAALSGSFRFTIPYPEIKDDVVRARLCSRDPSGECVTRYITVLRHTYDWLKRENRLQGDLNVSFPQGEIPVFVPFEDNNIRWNSASTYTSEQLLALKQDETNVLMIVLILVIVFLALYCMELKTKCKCNP